MTRKTHDLVAKIGTYTGPDGQEKNKYVHAGVVLEGPYGQFIRLNRYFNPASIPASGRDGSQITLSMFEPRDSFFDSTGNYDSQPGGYGGPGNRDMDEEIPF